MEEEIKFKPITEQSYDAPKRTKEDIVECMRIEMPWHLPPRLKPYMEEAMEIYKDQELSQLTEKYEKLRGAFASMLEAFNERNSGLDSTWYIQEESFKSDWNELAGLKEQ